MAVLLLTSATGSPGVTTTALGLALHWPRDVLLVDADRVPSQTVEAGHLGDRGTQGRGLMALAQAHREARDLAAVAWEIAVPLTDAEPPPHRRFLTGFTHPSGAELFTPVWASVASAFAALETAGIDVIVDAGRIGSGLPVGLLERTDAVLVVSRSSLRAMAALRLHLPTLLDHLDLAAPQAVSGLCVIGPAQPYSPAEITGHFGVPTVVTVPDSPAHAAVLSDAAAPPRRFDRGEWNRALHSAAMKLSGSLTRRSHHPGGPVNPTPQGAPHRSAVAS